MMRNGTEYLGELPPETHLIVFQDRVIAAGPNCPASWVGDDGSLTPIPIDKPVGIVSGFDIFTGAPVADPVWIDPKTGQVTLFQPKQSHA